MNKNIRNRLLKDCTNFSFIFYLLFIITTIMFILLNISFLRPIFGFFFITVVPGIFFLHIFNLNKLDLAAKMVLSVGLSTSFLMFLGILIDCFYLLIGYGKPLSQISILLSFSVAITILMLFAYLQNGFSFNDFFKWRIERIEFFYLILAIFLPFMSIIGVYSMNYFDNNMILIIMLLSIPAYVISISLYHNKIPERIYAPIIFLIGISLTFLIGLRSNHIIGSDIHIEYYIFRQTLFNEYWQIILNSVIDGCLSISVLPTIYQSFLNMNPEYIFKIIYPFVASMLPIIVYIISRRYISASYAFLASFFFMSQKIFLWAAYNPRTIIGIFFFALAIMILVHDGISRLNRRLLFIIFTISCTISHYSTTYIFIYILIFVWAIEEIFQIVFWHRSKASYSLQSPQTARGVYSKVISYMKDIKTSKLNNFSSSIAGRPNRIYLKRELNLRMILLFFIIIFFWYSQITTEPFNLGFRFMLSSLYHLQDFFVLESRGPDVASALGSNIEGRSLSAKITFVTSWITIIFLFIGILFTLIESRWMLRLPDDSTSQPPKVLSKKLDMEFFAISFACFNIMVISIVLPIILSGYSLDRAYCQMVIALSLFFVVGGKVIARVACLKNAYVILLLILIPFFLCNTGVIYQVFSIPKEITINSEGPQYNSYFIHDQESHSAYWLNIHSEPDAKFFTDHMGDTRLISQGLIHPSSIDASSIFESNSQLNGYIYLRFYNVVQKQLEQRSDKIFINHNLSEYLCRLSIKQKIYSNGGSEVYD